MVVFLGERGREVFKVLMEKINWMENKEKECPQPNRQLWLAPLVR